MKTSNHKNNPQTTNVRKILAFNLIFYKKVKLFLIVMCFLWINVLKIQAQNHIHSGDIEVNTQSEVDELADNELTEGINKINGNVSIIQEVDENGNPINPITDLSVFSAIDTIMGYIKVERTSSLGTLSKVETADNGTITYTGFASLDTLGGDFDIGNSDEEKGNSGLDSLGYFRDLKGIGGSFYVEENDNLIFLGTFPKLERIGNDYEIAYNENLISLGFFNVLQSIGGDFSVRLNDNLQTLGNFPKLESIGSDYEIGFNENLISLGFFNVLQSIGGDFSVRFNDNLQTLGNFPVLTNIDGDVDIHDNLMLRYCCAIKDFANFENDQFYGFVSISGNAMGCDDINEINCDPHLSTHLPEIYAEHTDTISNFTIISDGKWRLRKPAVGADWITHLAIKGKTGNLSRIEGEKESFITIKHTKNNDSDQRKTTLILEAIDSNGTVLNFPESTSLSVIQVSNKTYIGNISVGTQTEISDLSTSLTGVTKIMGNISVLQKMDENGTPIDPIIDLSVFSTIDTITGSLMMKGADSLRTLSKVETADNGMTTYIGFAALDTIGGDFSIGHLSAAFGNSGLDSLGNFRDLKGIGGNFHIEQNDNMVILGSFPKLKNIGGESIIIANDDLQTLGNFNSLQNIGENFSVRFNDNLQTLGNFNSLQTIGRYFFVTNNDSLQTLGNFDSLQTIGRYFFVTNNGNLQTLGNFNSLQTIRERFSVTNNSNLQTLGNFNSLQTIGKHFFVTNNSNLQTLGNFNAITNIGIERVFISSLRRSEDDVSIVIENNANLSDCCAIAELLSANNSGVAGKIFITGNAVGCDSRDNIISRRCSLIPILTLISENSTIDHNDTSPITIQFSVGGSAMGWTASIDSSFISLNTTNGNSGNNISLVATPTSANTGMERIAMIMLRTTGHEGTPDSVSLTITQGANTDTTTLTPPDTTTLTPTDTTTLTPTDTTTLTPTDTTTLTPTDTTTLTPTDTTTLTPPDTTTLTPTDTTTVSPPDTTTVSPPDTTTVSPPDTTTVSPPDTTTVSPPDTTTVSPPDTTTLSPPDTTTVSPPDTTTLTPTDTTTLTPTDTTTLTPTDTTTLTPTDTTTVSPPDTTTLSTPDTTTVSPPDTTTLSTPDTTTLTPPDTTTLSTPDTTTLTPPDTTTLTPPDTTTLTPPDTTTLTPPDTTTLTPPDTTTVSPPDTTTLSTPDTTTVSPPDTTTLSTPDTTTLTPTDTTTLTPTDTTVSPKDTTTLSSHTKESLFTFYPNPTEGTLTIERATGYLQIYIYDLVGREVMTYSLPSSKKTIDVSELPSGMYLISLQKNKERITKVLIKK